MNIENITSRQILDSRGNPTLETTVWIDTGDYGMAQVPSGASTGSHEAVELRDGGKEYNGLSVERAIKNSTGSIAKAVKGMDVREQAAIDQAMIELDGTVNKSKLGANAMLGVSLAVTRANAALQKSPLYKTIRALDTARADDPFTLPDIMVNILNGGRHADNGLKTQEFMIVPHAEKMADRVRMAAEVYQGLKKVLKERGLSTMLGDEGGFAPKIPTDSVALDFLVAAIKSAGYQPGKDVSLALDMAASQWYDPTTGRYAFGDTAGGLSVVGLIGLLEEWLAKYPIISLEDPLAEDDWIGWHELTGKLSGRVKIIGDDLFVTHVDRLSRGIEEHSATGVIIKPNQVGTLTETLAAISKASSGGLIHIVSHRSGETDDAFISDLAVATNAAYCKAGATARGERVAKYNRLLAIADELA